MVTDEEFLDFLCLGAQKSGTTYLVSALRAHPGIQLPQFKELHYFSPLGEYRDHGDFAQSNFHEDLSWYKEQFQLDERKRGEVSTHYIFDPGAAKRIKEAFPAVKLFVILRNPVERAFSQYNMERYKTCKERRPLIEIIRDEPDNEIIRRGFYFQQLIPYRELFGPDQLRVYLFEDMTADPAAFFLDLFSYLEVDTAYVPPATEKRMNKSRKTRFVLIPRTIRFARHALESVGLKGVVRALNNVGAGRWIRNFNNRYNQVRVDFRLTDSERTALEEIYLEDIERMEAILGRDLGPWKGRS